MPARYFCVSLSRTRTSNGIKDVEDRNLSSGIIMSVCSCFCFDDNGHKTVFFPPLVQKSTLSLVSPQQNFSSYEFILWVTLFYKRNSHHNGPTTQTIRVRRHRGRCCCCDCTYHWGSCNCQTGSHECRTNTNNPTSCPNQVCIGGWKQRYRYLLYILQQRRRI